jgi:hypothetical protein
MRAKFPEKYFLQAKAADGTDSERGLREEMEEAEENESRRASKRSEEGN